MATIPATSASTITFIGASDTTELLFPSLTSTSGPMDIESNPLLTVITFGAVITFGNTTLTFKDNALTQATMDHILSKVNANGTNNGTLDLSGPPDYFLNLYLLWWNFDLRNHSLI